MIEPLLLALPPVLAIFFGTALFLWAWRTIVRGDRFIKLRLAGVSTEEAEKISGFKLPIKKEKSRMKPLERIEETFHIEEWLALWAGIVAIFVGLFWTPYFIIIGGFLIVLTGLSMIRRKPPIVCGKPE